MRLQSAPLEDKIESAHERCGSFLKQYNPRQLPYLAEHMALVDKVFRSFGVDMHPLNVANKNEYNIVMKRPVIAFNLLSMLPPINNSKLIMDWNAVSILQ